MGAPDYKAPKIEKVGASASTSETEVEVPVTVQVETARATVAERVTSTADVILEDGKTYSPLIWLNVPEPTCYEDIVQMSEVIDPETQLVSDILIARIRKHLRHIRGELSYRNQAEKAADAFTFYNAFMLAANTPNYKVFEACMIELLSFFRNNPDLRYTGVFDNMQGAIPGVYKTGFIDMNNFNVLGDIAINMAKDWPNRRNYPSRHDISYPLSLQTPTGHDNLSEFFKRAGTISLPKPPKS